jgi:hypothetical protein
VPQKWLSCLMIFRVQLFRARGSVTAQKPPINHCMQPYYYLTWSTTAVAAPRILSDVDSTRPLAQGALGDKSCQALHRLYGSDFALS